MHVAEAGSGPPVILCHGFPELWYSWRHQLPALAAAGFRAVAPDQRGYGGTDAPPDALSYDIAHLTDDLTGLLDELGEERAAFVGHDWGAIVAWQLALLAPERVAAVARELPNRGERLFAHVVKRATEQAGTDARERLAIVAPLVGRD
jgi:pimeloyl-ACP methyl ester carboxylesterase